MEMDNEHVAVVAGDSGTGNSYTTLFRQYDPRLGRWLSVDPEASSYPGVNPYVAFGDNPVMFVDPWGDDQFLFDQKGQNIKRILKDGKHEYYLIHSNGNYTINGVKYFKGNSWYSFFGDREHPDKRNFDDIVLFKNINYTLISNDWKIKSIIYNKVDQKSSLFRFGIGSTDKGEFDYKNQYPMSTNAYGADNLYTAYMYNGILYNRNEASNILWGATSSYLKIGDKFAYTALNTFAYITEFERDEYAERYCIYQGRSLFPFELKSFNFIYYNYIDQPQLYNFVDENERGELPANNAGTQND